MTRLALILAAVAGSHRSRASDNGNGLRSGKGRNGRMGRYASWVTNDLVAAERADRTLRMRDGRIEPSDLVAQSH